MGDPAAGSATISLLKPREITFPANLDVRIALGPYGWAVVNILATGRIALTGGSGKNLTIIRAIYSHHFKNKSIVQCKTTKEFDDYLKCGRLEYSFLRVWCEFCHDEKLVAFSCKRRGFCPSCGARRMADNATLSGAHEFYNIVSM